MDCLLDTNILLRLANSKDNNSRIVQSVIRKLSEEGYRFVICSQNIIEFRNVATRPVKYNGFGWESELADAECSLLESNFTLLPDHPDVFHEWKKIVSELNIMGAQVHDARLFAVCQVYRVNAILTFNKSDFIRYQGSNSEFKVFDPITLT